MSVIDWYMSLYVMFWKSFQNNFWHSFRPYDIGVLMFGWTSLTVTQLTRDVLRTLPNILWQCSLEVMSKSSFSNVNRTFVQRYLVFKNIRTKMLFLHHSWNVFPKHFSWRFVCFFFFTTYYFFFFFQMVQRKLKK